MMLIYTFWYAIEKFHVIYQNIATFDYHPKKSRDYKNINNNKQSSIIQQKQWK